jgi:hypothetical protein
MEQLPSVSQPIECKIAGKNKKNPSHPAYSRVRHQLLRIIRRSPRPILMTRATRTNILV